VLQAPNEFSRDFPSFVQVVLQDWHVSKYFTEFIGTWMLTQSAVLGNGGASVITGGVSRAECLALSCRDISSAAWCPCRAVLLLVSNAVRVYGRCRVPHAGYTLICIVYVGGHISGAHYNPALTIGAWVRGLMPLKMAVWYLSSQILGGLCGAGVARGVLAQAGSCDFNDAGKVRCCRVCCAPSLRFRSLRCVCACVRVCVCACVYVCVWIAPYIAVVLGRAAVDIPAGAGGVLRRFLQARHEHVLWARHRSRHSCQRHVLREPVRWHVQPWCRLWRVRCVVVRRQRCAGSLDLLGT
jgi:hypothetical protein